MEKIEIIIEQTKDGYDAYSSNVEGIFGHGDNIEEAKWSIRKSISLLINNNPKKDLPPLLQGDYKIEYTYKYINQTRTIHFKNGETKIITQEIANLLKGNCLNGNSGEFKIFSNKEDEPFLFINLNEVTYID